MANNYVNLVGKLTKFEIRKAGSEHKIAELNIACYNGNEAKTPLYFQVKQWNPTDKTKKMLKRLDGEGRISVSGRLRMDSWEDEEEDRKVFRPYILADDRDGILEADEVESDEDEDGGKSKGKKRKGKKSSGGKKKRGKKNISKKKGKGKKKRREEEEDEDDDDDDEEEEEEDDDDDDWDED